METYLKTRKNGSKNLFFVHCHISSNVREERWAHKVPLLVALDLDGETRL